MAFERLGNFVHKTHIVFENLSNINGDMLQKTWEFKIGKDGPSEMVHVFFYFCKCA